MKKVSVLGATGSIGRQTIKVLKGLSGYKIISLSAHSNYKLLIDYVREFKPKTVCVTNEKAYEKAKSKIKDAKVLPPWQLFRLAEDKNTDIIIAGSSGSSALPVILAALKNGKTVAVANKEPIVMAGDILKKAAEKHGGKIIPVDSEHSAIFHCLATSKTKPEKIYITSSGGAILKRGARKITPAFILKHPIWKMGKKITVDSSTGVNKGFEVIEAHHLFGIDFSKIGVILHPEAIVHGIVEYADGSSVAYLSRPDMKIPIKYALTYPQKLPLKNFLDYKNLNLTFKKFPEEKYACFCLAVKCGKKGGVLPSSFCGANETTVKFFLKGKIPFSKIPKIIEKTVSKTPSVKYTIENCLKIEKWAMDFAGRIS
ncbi:MAG: 1-deoxy-D-xylulose-5-phosphate reductoisomerase [Elusimicrobia bacterium]|nr:1-deoxy-D-xylulose-5-phosphate reductoisomerase [Elusimicrobiota bacterium]